MKKDSLTIFMQKDSPVEATSRPPAIELAH